MIFNAGGPGGNYYGRQPMNSDGNFDPGDYFRRPIRANTTDPNTVLPMSSAPAQVTPPPPSSPVPPTAGQVGTPTTQRSQAYGAFGR